MIRIVTDSNIFISGILRPGNPYRILKSWRDRETDIVSSAPIIEETCGVLDRKFHRGKEEIEELRTEIIENAIIVEPKDKIDAIKDDPDDNKILEAAVEGEVDYIVSGDKHLKRLGVFKGIKIVPPAEMIEILNRSKKTKPSESES